MSSYQSKYTGGQVEHVLDNAILKVAQTLSDEELEQVKANLKYVTGDDVSDAIEDAINSIPTPDVSGQINSHNEDTSAHPYIQSKIEDVRNDIPTNISDLTNDKGFVTEKQVTDLIDNSISNIPTPDVGGQISAALVDYVKKVEGKGLSTNDFTNELKTKLEGITPYDPSELEAEIDKLETALNTLVGGNASNAIESFNEIIAFLDGISDSEDLDSIIASIEQQIASKYSKPLSGIPESDLSSDVQSSLNKAETALQEERYKGTISAVDANESVDEPEMDNSINVLDNGNIKVTINGVSKDFMPATPSGDPMHHYYESLGAQWNDGEDKTLQIPIYGKDFNTTEYFPVVHKSKRWYFNLLGDITNAQMAEIVSYPRSIFGDDAYSNCKARTIVFEGNSLGAPISFDFFGTRSSIVSLYTKNAFYPSSARNIFYAAQNLKYVLGDPSNRGYFNGDYGIDSSWNGTPKNLEEIRIFTAKKNIGLQNSPKLSKTSVLFMVNEAIPTTAITIKLHATAYARVANDEEVIAALDAKNAALQGTGGSVSIVSA